MHAMQWGHMYNYWLLSSKIDIINYHCIVDGHGWYYFYHLEK